MDAATRPVEISSQILVLLTAPLGLIGASLALNLSNKPFGFVALLGLIALAGMIMRNVMRADTTQPIAVPNRNGSDLVVLRSSERWPGPNLLNHR